MNSGYTKILDATMFAMADESTYNVVSIALLISVVIAIAVPWYRKLLKRPGYGWWGLPLAVLTTFVYLIYEACMPSRMIRIDVIIVWPVMLFVWINAMLALRDYENTVIYVEGTPPISDQVRPEYRQNRATKSAERRTLFLAIVIGVISLLHWYAGTGLSIILLFFLIPDLLRALMIKRNRHTFWNRALATLIVFSGILFGLLIHHGG